MPLVAIGAMRFFSLYRLFLALVVDPKPLTQRFTS